MNAAFALVLISDLVIGPLEPGTVYELHEPPGISVVFDNFGGEAAAKYLGDGQFQMGDTTSGGGLLDFRFNSGDINFLFGNLTVSGDSIHLFETFAMDQQTAIGGDQYLEGEYPITIGGPGVGRILWDWFPDEPGVTSALGVASFSIGGDSGGQSVPEPKQMLLMLTWIAAVIAIGQFNRLIKSAILQRTNQKAPA